MLSSGMGMLSSVMICYHLEVMLSSGMKCYHLGWKWYHLEQMVASGINVIIWDYMLSSGMKCYHLGCNVIIWDKMLSTEANVIMVSSGANVIIWCYHVMLSSGMITPPFFVFPGNFTHSWLISFKYGMVPINILYEVSSRPNQIN